VGEDHRNLGQGLQELIKRKQSASGFPGISMADRFAGMEENGHPFAPQGPENGGQPPDPFGGQPFPIKADFPESGEPLCQAAVSFPLRLPPGAKGKTGERQKPPRVMIPAFPEKIVSLLAEARVFPRKAANYRSLNSFPFHALQKVFRAGQAGFLFGVKEAKCRVAPEKGTPVLDDGGRKHMGVGVDDHGKRIVQPGKM